MARTPTPAPPIEGAPSPASAVAATSSAADEGSPRGPRTPRGTPDECGRCGGLGGFGGLFFVVGDPIFERYCDCAEGRRLAMRQAANEDLADCAVGELAGIPDRFRGLRFESFPLEEAKGAAVARMRRMGASGERRGVYLHGAFGTGKTGLAVCALRKRVLLGDAGWFITAAEWLDLLRPGGPQEQAMARGLATDLLVLDDLGAERLTGWGREQLFRLLNGRHAALLATIVTSNYSLEDLAPRLAGDADWREGERICWRIAEACEVIELVGKNLRKPT